jgi:hypothetical protein
MAEFLNGRYMTITQRAERRRKRRERWDIATRALREIANNKKEGEKFWFQGLDIKYFRLVALNEILLLTFAKHRYSLRDYWEELEDFAWMVL